jgi:hypothetical protein
MVTPTREPKLNMIQNIENNRLSRNIESEIAFSAVFT